MDGIKRTVSLHVLALLAFSLSSGCNSFTSRGSLTKNAIPAAQFACMDQGRRDSLVPIDFTRLRQTIPAEHVIGPRDVLGIYIEGVLDDENKLPAVSAANFNIASEGITPYMSPGVGHPVRVEQNGTVVLPYVAPVNVKDMTLGAAVEAIRNAYTSAKILDPTKTKFSVSLIRARTYHIVVMREDSANTGVIGRSVQILSQRGSGDALELPAFKNDVLHALTATGGLPGEDAANEVWIFRRGADEDWSVPWNVMQQFHTNQGGELISVADESGLITDDCGCITDQATCSNAIRIPLRVECGAPPTFTAEDVILQDGDVVYVASREQDYFIGAGVLSGGKYILPRDIDTDIFDAIAIANTSALGPSGTNAGTTIFRNGPGNIVAPSRVIVIRQLANGKQVKIEIDLRAAANDPKERLIIKPGDVVMLRYRPSELVANTLLNMINIGYAIPNR